ncbi:MAG: adenylosuccinate synthetase [Candidatus Aenigmarchaeota archaeon]|nr:adenylosuccinate synthetase [Candidatus Aenigmarchaeota archaeon]
MAKSTSANSQFSRYVWNGVGVVIGGQWGDEGKGKFVSDLAPYVDVFVRSQGGPNSGHTVMVNGRKYAFHQVPSGAAFRKPSIMTAGMVINPLLLYDEMQQVDDPSVVLIDARTAVITRAHRALDGYGEINGTAIGTTRQGMGPAYESKANRRELITIGDMLDKQRLAEKIANYALAHAVELLQVAEMEQIAVAKGELDPKNALVQSNLSREQYCNLLTDELFAAGQKLAPHIVDDTSIILQQAVNSAKRILVEGAQGVLLDRDVGTVPYVTSSRTTAGATLADAGLSRYADQKNGYWGVIKAYTTRVGGGPFPTELKNGTGELLRQKGFEFGTTTGRARRTGWFDAVATAYAIRMGEISSGYLTKIDVLSAVKEPMICVAYEIDGARTAEFPADARVLGRAIPILEPAGRIERINRHDIVMAGRKKGFDALPENARAYVERVETLLRDLSGAKDFEISAISVGPWKGQTVVKQAFV